MTPLCHRVVFIGRILIVCLIVQLGLQDFKRTDAQSEFDGCLIKLDHCYRQLTSNYMNLELTKNVEWIYNEAIEDFQNLKSTNVMKCNEYAERICHMWQQAEGNRNYTGQDMRSFEYYHRILKSNQSTKSSYSYDLQPEGGDLESDEDHPEYTRERFEEDNWTYEDCIWEGESEEYCEQFW